MADFFYITLQDRDELLVLTWPVPANTGTLVRFEPPADQLFRKRAERSWVPQAPTVDD